MTSASEVPMIMTSDSEVPVMMAAENADGQPKPWVKPLFAVTLLVAALGGCAFILQHDDAQTSGLIDAVDLGETCPNTCHGNDCNFWNGHGYSCHDLENIYGCHCTGCSACGGCPATCHGQTCEFWQHRGYHCDALENKYGCDCSQCTCGSTPSPDPAPRPAPGPSPSGSCEPIKPTHHYPLPSNTYTAGLPSPIVAKPSGMTMCEVQQLQDDCVEKINSFRAGTPFSDGRTRDHGHLSPLTKSADDFSKCMNEKALSDLEYAHHKNMGCGHYSMSLTCGLDLFAGAENSCCPRNCRTYASCKRALFNCLQSMWDEGQIVLDTGSIKWTMETGHYWNMIGDRTHVGCGFGFDSQGKMLATQNFYSD